MIVKKTFYVKVVIIYSTKKKEISANLIKLKREPPNNFDHMLPKYIST